MSSPASPHTALNPLVSVVVPTRNRAGSLRALLAALALQTYPHVEIVVVDDASSDETSLLLRSWEGEGRVALRVDASGGSYAARNFGWRHSQGEIIAFTDDDCLPAPEWIASLATSFATADILGVQGRTLVGTGEATPFTHQIEQRSGGPPYRTCNIAYRRGILDALGGFQDSLRWYADNLFGFAVCQWGEIVFAPTGLVLHPPRPRVWRSRSEWRARFGADAEHRRQLQQLGAEIPLPSGALPVLLWVVRPLIKQSRAHLRYALRHPGRYGAALRPMLHDKRELAIALRSYYGRTGKHVELPALDRNPLISVIIVTRERSHLLAALLADVRAQTWQRREIIVADHGPDEETRAVSAAMGARYVQVSGTLGAARQAAVDVASGQIIAFTDDDCRPEPTWLEHIVRAFRDDPTLSGVQGRTESDVGEIGMHTVRISRPSSLYQTCNIAYRKDAILRVGGFDQRFAGWFEDTALGARVTAQGTIGWAPQMLVHHRAVPRLPLTRARWRQLLADEQLLAGAYRGFYWRTRGPGWLLTTLARWLVGSALKRLLQAREEAQLNPGAYLSLALWLLRERIALLAALADVLREGIARWWAPRAKYPRRPNPS